MPTDRYDEVNKTNFETNLWEVPGNRKTELQMLFVSA